MVSEDIHEIAALPLRPEHTSKLPTSHIYFLSDDVHTTQASSHSSQRYHHTKRSFVTGGATVLFVSLLFLAARSEVGQGVQLLIYPLCWP